MVTSGRREGVGESGEKENGQRCYLLLEYHLDILFSCVTFLGDLSCAAQEQVVEMVALDRDPVGETFFSALSFELEEEGLVWILRSDAGIELLE